MKTALNRSDRKKTDNNRLEPILQKVLNDAEVDHKQMQSMFELMGWGELPDQLKMEIRDDVRSYADELAGLYSSCDPFVQRRRESVDFWVQSYFDGLCTLDTAVRSLRVKNL